MGPETTDFVIRTLQEIRDSNKLIAHNLEKIMAFIKWTDEHHKCAPEKVVKLKVKSKKK